MARKGENIYKRTDGRWEGRYIIGRKPNGKPSYKSIYGNTYGEVKAKLLPLKSTYATSGNVLARFSGTLWDWLICWLNELQKPYVKPSTYSSYRNKLECHVQLVLGSVPLAKLTETDIQTWVNGMIEKGLAGTTVRTICRILSNALQKAVTRHFLLLNPCNTVTLPAVEQGKVRALTIAQQCELEQQALANEGNEAVIIALYTGMRIGEISALTWDDVDFENNLLHVRRTLQRIQDYEGVQAKTRISIETPKTHTSYRTIPFAENLRTHMLGWKTVSNSEFVVSCKGHRAEPRVISYRFKQIAAKAGMEGVSFHSLRHTCATRGIEHGIDPVTLSRLLGHASPKLTLDTYADSTMDQRKYAMTVLDTLLLRDGKLTSSFDMAVGKRLFAMLSGIFGPHISTVS